MKGNNELSDKEAIKYSTKEVKRSNECFKINLARNLGRKDTSKIAPN